jgi:hypothetical protein
MPPRQLVGIGVLVACEPHELDDLGGSRPPLGLAHTADLQPVGHVVEDLSVWEQPEVLEHHRHVVAAQLTQARVRHGADVLAVEADLAGAGLDQAGQAAHQGGLAGARQTP